MRRYHTEFSSHGDLATGICANLLKVFIIINYLEPVVFFIRIEQNKFCSILFPVKLNKSEVRLLEPKRNIFGKAGRLHRIT